MRKNKIIKWTNTKLTNRPSFLIVLITLLFGSWAHSACRIEMTACPSHPTTYNLPSFIDTDYMDNNLSARDSARCMQRAQEYYTWCGSQSPVSASFILNDVVQKTTTHPQTSATSITTEDGVLFESIKPKFGITVAPFPWGVNQSKIVRKGQDVYMLYNVDSQDCTFGNTQVKPGKVTLFKKTSDGPWVKGTTFPLAVAGLLVDPSGYIRIHGYWDGNPACTPDTDKAGIYLWSSWQPGTIAAGFPGEWVEKPPRNNVSVATGRTGAAVDMYGNLMVSEGVGYQSVAWVKQAQTNRWQKVNISATDGAYYYPYVQPLAAGYFTTLSSRIGNYSANPHDQFNGAPLIYPNYSGSWKWDLNVLFDKRGQSHLIRVEPNDILEDTQGTLHMLIKDYDSTNGRGVHTWHLSTKSKAGAAGVQYLDDESSPIGALFAYTRMVEIKGRIFFISAANSKIYFRESQKGQSRAPDYGWRSIDIPSELLAGTSLARPYVYVSSPRGGGDRVSQFVDLLALDASGAQAGLGFYIRIPTQLFLKN